jgi:hypothetical protein
MARPVDCGTREPHTRLARSARRPVGVRRCARERVPRPVPRSGPPRRSQSCGPARPIAGHRSRSDRPRAGQLDGATSDCAQTRERAARRARSAAAPPATNPASSSRGDARYNGDRDGCTVPCDAGAGSRPRCPRDAARTTRLARHQGPTERRTSRDHRPPPRHRRVRQAYQQNESTINQRRSIA